MALEDPTPEQRLSILRSGGITLALGVLLVALSSVVGMRAAREASEDAAPTVVASMPTTTGAFCGDSTTSGC